MRAIRAGILSGVGLAIVLLVSMWLGAAETKPASAKMPDVDQRVKALEEKVAELEKKLEQVSSALQSSDPLALAPRFEAPRAPIAPPVPPGALLAPTPLPVPDGLPKVQVAPAPPPDAELPPGVPPDALPREFNGRTYYIVPLTEGAPHK